MTVALLFVSFGLLLLIGVPIVWCMAVASLVAVLLGGVHMPLAWFAQQVLIDKIDPKPVEQAMELVCIYHRVISP